MNLKTTLTILFGVSVTIAAILAGKITWLVIPLIGGVAIPAGWLPFSVSYLCSDLLVEFEGEDAAHDAVNATILALVVSYVFIYAAILMPAAPFYEHAEAFETVLGSGSNVLIGSIIAITISQHTDVRLFGAIRRRTGPGRKWARNIGSTATSQALDTVLFITVAFTVMPFLTGGHVMWGVPLLLTILGQYLVKLGAALADTPVFYAVAATRTEETAAQPTLD